MSIFYMWIIILIACLVVEIATVGLTSIWFAGGAVAALIVEGVGGNIAIQAVVFFVVSVVLLVFTRPFAMKYINKNKYKSNYEGAIGKVARVTREVNNFADTGTAVVDGMEWTARTAQDGVILQPGEEAKVVDVQGVKLILEKKEV